MRSEVWAGEGCTVFGERLPRVAEGLGVVLPEQDDRGAYVAAGLDRRASVFPVDEQRRTFWVYLRSGHLRLAAGMTADPAEMVRAVAAWADGAGLEETKERAPFIEFRPWALAHEREPLGAVELEWCRRLDGVHTWPMNGFPRVHALLVAAYAQPVLRRLMPVTSHDNLWFSTSTIPNWHPERVGPMIWPHYERTCAVRDGHEVLAQFETPEETVAFVVACLPEGTGPTS
ncbi:DUF6193 family natural product biosynthesis protein [Kitasatospora phosalacinea]|uniref:DUF6193 family natural product biosynthesis protein n=1 Tax=Kitasatospora phosalacinea TaxID=2065 RepID=UPI00068F8A3D|nr:DUF6193 family natural product biosynthesis protein [Kitasatospora phosalacinea]